MTLRRRPLRTPDLCLVPAHLPATMTESLDTITTYEDDTIIFEQGDIGTEAYKIISGHVAVLVGFGPISLRKQVALLEAGRSFGDVAVHSPNSRRTATCVARGLTSLQVTSKTTTNVLSPVVPSLGSLLLETNQDKTVPTTKEVTYSMGDHIVREGDQNADSWYVIIKGCVDVSVKMKNVGCMTEGEIFGEQAILNQNKTRSASVVARGEVVVLRMSIDDAGLRENAGLREMLQRRRVEIEKKNHLREFNCQTSRPKQQTRLISDLHTSQTARPLMEGGYTPLNYVPKSLQMKVATFESTQATGSNLRTKEQRNPFTKLTKSKSKWGILQKQVLSGDSALVKATLAALNATKKTRNLSNGGGGQKWNLLRRMVVKDSTPRRLSHVVTARQDLTQSEKIILIDRESAAAFSVVQHRRNQAKIIKQQDEEDKKDQEVEEEVVKKVVKEEEINEEKQMYEQKGLTTNGKQIDYKAPTKNSRPSSMQIFETIVNKNNTNNNTNNEIWDEKMQLDFMSMRELDNDVKTKDEKATLCRRVTFSDATMLNKCTTKTTKSILTTKNTMLNKCTTKTTKSIITTKNKNNKNNKINKDNTSGTCMRNSKKKHKKNLQEKKKNNRHEIMNKSKSAVKQTLSIRNNKKHKKDIAALQKRHRNGLTRGDVEKSIEAYRKAIIQRREYFLLSYNR